MIEQFLTTQLIHALGWTLLHSLWQGALFAVLLGVLLIALRKFSSTARYLVCVGTLTTFLVCVAGTFVQLYQSSPTLSAGSTTVVAPATGTAATAAERPAPTEVTAIEPNVATARSVPFAERMVHYFDTHLPLLVTLWFLGVLVLQLRLLGRLAYVQRLKSYGVAHVPPAWHSAIAELEQQFALRRQVQYRLSRRVTSPMVVGWLQPVVLFPAALVRDLRESQIVSILAHELAHVKRDDFVVNIVQTVVSNLFFFHPGVWWMSSRIEEAREHCCDDLACTLARRFPCPC